MAALPENMSLAIDELETAIAEMESRLESARAERDESKARQIELEIENANLRRELGLAHERQSAGAEILRTIASTPGNAAEMLQRIAETTARLFGAPSASIRLAENGEWTDTYRFGESANLVRAAVPLESSPIGGPNLPGAVVAENRQINIPDLDNIDPAFAHWPGPPVARAAGTRTMCGTPLRREGKAIGVLIVYRDHPLPFTEQELTLQQSFADQAVIAIENTRLFNETQEALERQKASADILRVISSSIAETKPVFDEIVNSVQRLFRTGECSIFLLGPDGLLHVGAMHGSQAELVAPLFPIPIKGSGTEAVLRARRVITYADVMNDAGVPEGLRALARRIGQNYSIAAAPMLAEGRAVGSLAVGRYDMKPFTERECDLLQSLADQAVIAIENTRLFNETQESLQQQTATADVLRVIASSPADVRPVLDAIVENACTLCDASDAYVALKDGNDLVFQTQHGSIPVAWKRRPINRQWPAGRAVVDGTAVHLHDVLASEGDEFPDGREIARRDGARTVLTVPLMREGESIGVIILRRTEVLPFANKQIALLETFADQAVIAIENTRLFNETQEALERQTATADILKVIAGSPSDVQPVFDTIAESARRLCGGHTSIVTQVIGDLLHLRASSADSEAGAEELRAAFPIPLSANRLHGRAALSGEIAFRYDTENEPDVTPTAKETARVRGYRSLLAIPMMREGVAIGTIGVSRREAGHFPDKFIELLRTFADQAVIAIENARLIRETQEALERQTATADILKVIASSPSDVQPVFDAIAASGHRLLGGFSTSVFSIIDDMLHLSAFTPTNPAADAALQAAFPRPVSAESWNLRVLNGETVEIPDVEAAPMVPENLREMWRKRGFRSLLLVPLVRSGKAIGMINTTRVQPGPFSSHHVQLLQTFADQAVIAIENTRLFNETQEALERQTATADILKVIASSPSDVQPVFEAIAASAKRLLGGFSSTVFRFIGGTAYLKAFTPTTPQADEVLTSTFPQPIANFQPFRLTQSGEVAQIPDTEDPAYQLQGIARARGYRSIMYAPLMNKGTSIGFIGVTRVQPGSFADHHVQLLKTFADQAVIAIENTRLFNETKEALERQTATADILKVIASSPSDVQPVFDAIVASAKRLLGGHSCGLYHITDDMVHLKAFTPLNDESDEALRNSFPSPRSLVPQTALVEKGESTQFADTENAPEFQAKIARARGFRSILMTPLTQAGKTVGMVAVTRRETGSFADHHVHLMKTFADQAVIAIENTRLFNETREALERQTATSDILKVIASSPSDVQPVFDVIVERAVQLCGARIGRVYRYDGELIHLVGGHGLSVPGREGAQRPFPRPASDDTIVGRVMLSCKPNILADLNEDDSVPPLSRQMITAIGARSQVTMPMLLKGEPIGAITLSWAEPRGYTDQQIALLRTFADQAVIAIENARLFNEVQQRTEDLSEALQQQTATADVLKVISRSAFDLDIVLDTLTASAASLCDADVAAVTRPHPEGGYHHATRYNFSPEWERMNETVRLYPGRGSLVGRVLLEGKAVQIADVLADPEYAFPEQQRVGGYRTLLGVPLLREGQPTGVLLLGRTRLEPFTDRQIELVQTYADQAVIAIENVRLFDEVQAKTRDLSEALTHQTGSANILRVIASSPTDVEPVLQSIVESACELCDANDAAVLLRDGDYLSFRAHHGPIAIDMDKWPISRDWASGRAFVDRATVHLPDIFAEEARDFTASRALSEHTSGAGVRSVLSVPLLREGESIGAILLRRTEMQPYTDKQIALLQTFADQAVIAIGNVRLFEEVQAKTRDLSEALTYQTGSANILRVIASSPTDIKPVLDAIVESACELCGAYDAVLRLKKGDELELGAHHGTVPADWNLSQINPNWTAGRAALEQRPVHVHDMSSSEGDEFPEAQARARDQGHRTILSVPLLQEANSIGTLTLRRLEVNPFSDKQIALLQTFADQAVIAIGNVRLFEEVQAKTRDLSESLQFQTASSEVLKVISSSPDALQPVLDAIAQTSQELCGSDASTIFLLRDGKFHFAALSGDAPKHVENLRNNPASIDEPLFGRLVREKRTLHFANVMDDPELPRSRRIVMGGPRALLAAPLLRDGEAVGAIVLRRSNLKPFTPRQVQAIEVFADQAVIAISNVELFEEVQRRTRELSESLEQQVATSEVLQVISSSPGELEPVFQSMLANATRLCQAECGVMWLRESDAFRSVAIHGPLPPAYVEQWRSGTPVDPTPHSKLSILLQTGKAVHVPDMREDRSYLERDPLPVAAVEVAGIRTLLLVPMSKEDELVGGIAIYRQEVRPFADKQVELVSTFARQAVIAIENARLLKELRQRTDDLGESLQQQTATADVLQIISSSPGDLAPVFEKMLVNATRVCGAKFGSMLLAENGSLRPAAQYNVPAEFAVARGDNVFTPHPKSALAKAISTKQVVHVADMRTTEAYLERSPASVQFVELGGARTVAIVPMLRDDEVIGAITVYRDEVQLFSDKQIELLSNFAKQAVIAIENARLLKELRQRTDDLSQSLHELRTAQDRLVQTEKLASLGQLTAGIAHEIKNPLNFVNNFAALSAELTQELNEVLKPAGIGDKMRAEVNELTGLLKDNLEKVVQHGKRADSIVKNMLLHSREGGGEHRLSDINAVVDESLNLAYHGARAERPDFNVTLERDFDPAAGQVDLFPQEITRVFLNLVSNGFYAVTKRRKEAGEPGFEPTLRASTRNLGESVEIRIRDNGTGIPPGVKEKMFNPFFTTKPAGEGTGLGLSMSHDIIVKQHGGTIDVDTSPGDFTEFRIVLPRTSNFADKSRG